MPPLELAIKERDVQLLDWAERIIQQRQYETLDKLTPRPVDKLSEKVHLGDVTCLFQITELVFQKNEGSTHPLSIVLNALHASGATCIMLVQYQNGKAEIYLGAVNKQRFDNLYYRNTLRDILRSSLEGNLPGTELREIVSRQEIERKIAQCLDNGFDSQCITAVSCVTDDTDKGNTSHPGIENLLEAIGNKNFSLMILADPVNREQMRVVRQGYEELGTYLSSLSEMSISIQSGVNKSINQTVTDGFSTSIGKSISRTQSHTVGTNWTDGNSRTNTEKTAKNYLQRGASLLAAAATIETNPFLAMSAVSTLFGSPSQAGTQHSEGGNEQHSTSDQEGLQKNETINKAYAMGTAEGISEGVSIQTTTRNRHVQEMLERVDWYLKWLNRCENYGMFNCSAYILSSNASTNLMLASQYQALMQNNTELSQSVTINTWTPENGVDHIRASLKQMTHPVLQNSAIEEGLTPAMLLSSQELSRQMALPQHSIVGLSVMDYASFGREIARKTPLKTGRLLRVGAISHMGKTMPKNSVLLDMQSMAAHSFVAGTNGSGKSNTIFRILEELMDASIPFLVIEPAKGEYKNVFGHESNVRVYGTNHRKTELLRLNPFWFNDDVDILEHIEHLVGVFNASWPMYAAMPAVLKASIESAYKKCGWNLKQSVCRFPIPIYPTVRDVLDEFQQNMESTAFSQEVKGNYVGALSTRLESLCNGIYGEIFGGRNLTDEELFDSNVIIDISRVGSAETKAMIMGILIIRLQEYRMRMEAMNLPLQHITILEEAHHLLKRTSTIQQEDNANLVGKSVEMLATAIAEMRSYGEGFIIVDQSPGLMDMSVIRNTNTKILLRLPESSDRETVGRAMGLSPEQIYELSRLKTGICAIYQQDWLEAVLCQVDRATHTGSIYVHQAIADSEYRRRTQIVKLLLNKNTMKLTTEQYKLIAQCGLSGKEKAALFQELSNPIPNKAERRKLICQLAELELYLPSVLTEDSVDNWYRELVNDTDAQIQWGADEYVKILESQIIQLSLQNSSWKTLWHYLPTKNSTWEQDIKESRGRAFQHLCPLYGKMETLTPQLQAQLLQDVTALAESDASDIKLSQLLRRYLDCGTIRLQGELAPYTSIVWERMGGTACWEQLSSLVESNSYEQWDAQARQHMKEAITTDFNTETSILSLFLQHRGSMREVKAFYSPWLRSVKPPKTTIR